MVAASAEAKSRAVAVDQLWYAAFAAGSGSSFTRAVCAAVCVCPLVPSPTLGPDFAFPCGFTFRKKLCAKLSNALEFSSAIEPDHVPSLRIATNWSDVAGSSATYATSLQRKPFSAFQSSTVSLQISQLSLFLSPSRYATSPYSLIAKKASSGPQVTILGGPARQPEGVSHDCSVSSRVTGRFDQRMNVVSQAMYESEGPNDTRRCCDGASLDNTFCRRAGIEAPQAMLGAPEESLNERIQESLEGPMDAWNKSVEAYVGPGAIMTREPTW